MCRGELVFPVSAAVGAEVSDEELADLAGADLLVQPADIASWICRVAQGDRLCIGNYTYVDGARFVRLSLAADLVGRGNSERRDARA